MWKYVVSSLTALAIVLSSVGVADATTVQASSGGKPSISSSEFAKKNKKKGKKGKKNSKKSKKGKKKKTSS